MVKVKEDMTGWKMWEHGIPDSRLTVLTQTDDYISPNGTHYAQWLCECNCDNKTKVVLLGNDIRRGHAKSCGCLKQEKTIISNKYRHKTNRYDLSGLYGIGWTSNTNKEFYFDLEDYDKIKDYCWSENISKGYSSLVAWDANQRKVIKMTLILNCVGYDHKNRNTLDNRRCNLRQATQQENVFNTSLRKNNMSGIIGVYWKSEISKWGSQIRINGIENHLGYFVDKDDAIIARLMAEAKYYGEFAPQKHLFEQYKININGGDNQ